MSIKTIYHFTALTGGAATALDSVDGNSLLDLDRAFVIAASTLYVYELDADSGAAESSPDVISPDTNAGTKRWILITAYSLTSVTVSVTAADNISTTAIATTAFAKSQDSVLRRAPDQAVKQIDVATGSSSGVQVADNANIDVGIDNFTYVFTGSLPDWTPSADSYLLVKGDMSGAGLEMIVQTNGIIRMYLRSIATYDSTVATALVNNTTTQIAIVVTRESASAAGSIAFYVNGVLLGASVAITAGAPTTLSNAFSLYVLGGPGTAGIKGGFAGTCSSAIIFNRALTAAEVLDLYRNGINFADKWGSQTAVYSDTAWTGATGATPPTGWTVGAGGLVAVHTIFNSGDGAPYDACLKVEHNGVNNNPYVYRTYTTTIGKKYRCSFAFKHGTATSGQVGLGNTFGGNEYQIWSSLTDASWTIRNYDFEATTATTYISLNITSSTGGQYELYDQVYLYEIGAMIALEPEGIQTDKWYDSSNNNLDASYPATGSSLTRRGFKGKGQPTPTAKTTAVTLTIAELLTGIITGTHAAGATQAYTLPTGTLSDAGVSFNNNDSFDWVLINLSAAAADTITVTAGDDHTVVGNMIVQSAHATTGALYGNSATFRTRKTASNTFVTYRIA